MCVSLAVALAAGSAALGATGSIMGGLAARNAANANAALANQNSAYAATQASDAIQRGQTQAAMQYQQTGQLEGQQRAAEAANGIELGYGSPLDVAAGTAVMSEGDISRLRTNAQREAQGYAIQSANYSTQANMDVASGQGEFMKGILGAGSSILGGAQQIAKINANAGKASGGGSGFAYSSSIGTGG